jgi:1,4-alpha-glucan branching enzyme
MIQKRPSHNPGKVIVTFQIPGAVWADRIHLLGEFNGWSRDSLPLRPNRNGQWEVEVELEAGREYRFRYLIDGEYYGYDWQADKHLVGADGRCDSVVLASSPASR